MTRIQSGYFATPRIAAGVAAFALVFGSCGADAEPGRAESGDGTFQAGDVESETNESGWTVPVEHCSDDPEVAPYNSLQRALEGGFIGITTIVRASAVGGPEPADGRWNPPLDRSTFVVDEVVFENTVLHEAIGLELVEMGELISTYTIPESLVASQYDRYYGLEGASDVYLMIGSAGLPDGYRIFGVATADGRYVPSDVCASAVPDLIANVSDVLELDRLEAVIALAEYRSQRDSGDANASFEAVLPLILNTSETAAPPTVEEAWARIPISSRSLRLGEVPISEKGQVRLAGINFGQWTSVSDEASLLIRCDRGISEYGSVAALRGGSDIVVLCSTGTISLHVGLDRRGILQSEPVATVEAGDMGPSNILAVELTSVSDTLGGSLTILPADQWDQRDDYIDSLSDTIAAQQKDLFAEN